MTILTEQVTRVKNASRLLAKATTEEKNRALRAMANALLAHHDEIFAENGQDVAQARLAGMSEALLNRLAFTEKTFKETTNGILNVASLPDPVGEVLERTVRPNGLVIEKVRVPFGVICAIFESRPNVAIDITALCLKTGNAVVLRGGKEAQKTNAICIKVMQEALKGLLPDDVILLVTGGHETVDELITMRGLIDLCFPRGGKGLIRAVVDHALVPVIETGAGNCHLYVEKTADFDMALSIAENAKAQRPAVCNSIENLLVDREIASSFLPLLAERFARIPVEMRGDAETRAIIACREATDEDFYTEYDDDIIALGVVSDVKDAVAHINRYGTHHSDAIVTKNDEAARYFLDYVDSACVYVNASTRFTDGGEFGLGAELGISTQKLHARGPMGLKELTSFQYHILGNGQIRS